MGVSSGRYRNLLQALTLGGIWACRWLAVCRSFTGGAATLYTEGCRPLDGIVLSPFLPFGLVVMGLDTNR